MKQCVRHDIRVGLRDERVECGIVAEAVPQVLGSSPVEVRLVAQRSKIGLELGGKGSDGIRIMLGRRSNRDGQRSNPTFIGSRQYIVRTRLLTVGPQGTVAKSSISSSMA